MDTNNFRTLALHFIQKLFTNTIKFGLAEIFYRVIIIIKEYISYRHHYSGKSPLIHIIKHGFSTNNKIKYLLYILTVYCAILISQDYMKFFLTIFDEELAVISIVFCGLRWMESNKNLTDTAEWIRSGSGLDYATGMASNYFHGNLHLQLPDKGDDIKGIRQRIETYEDKHGVKFAIKRLFILVPESLHCRPRIDSEILEKADPLEPVEKERAGVKRPFKNDVYRFKERINNQIYYISLEGATPLLSFHEAMNYDITSTSEMKAMQREILLQFHKSVKKYTSECPATEKECEIVYYNDYDTKGNPTDVGYILKHHIEQMLKERKS